MSKNINARIAMKRDTSANWTTNNPVILNGEIILVDTAEGQLRAKVGDGVKTYTQLPFTDEVIRALITEVENNNSAVVLTKNGEAKLLDTFNIVKLTQSEYNDLVAAGTVDPDALYLTEGGEEEESDALELGETADTAYRGDRGKIAYDHSQTTGNPHNTTKNNLGLGNVENKSSETIRSELTKANVTTALGYTPPEQDTTYDAASQTKAGLMSSEDKKKLDGIADNANNYTYTLPEAGDVLGGVKSGGDVTISGGIITVNDNSHNHSIEDITDYIPVGENVEGQEFIVFDNTITAQDGAEIFNDYENNIATGRFSHSEGLVTIAAGLASHAEGHFAFAEGDYSHVEGKHTTASGRASHAEGEGSTASGDHSHAEGGYTIASGEYSHAGGNATIAEGENQTAIGRFNIADTTSLFIIGNGYQEGTTDYRSNALRVDDLGNTYLAGNIYINGDETNPLTKTNIVVTDINGTSKTLETFNIVRISQANYDALVEAGTNDPDTLYLTENTGEGGNDNGNYLSLTGGTLTGPLDIADTTASTSSSTGALTVAGGAGIEGDLYIGGSLNVRGTVIDGSTSISGETTIDNSLNVAENITANGDITGSKVYGAVWNDYAEFRKADSIEPGRVVAENGDDTMSLTVGRL